MYGAPADNAGFNQGGAGFNPGGNVGVNDDVKFTRGRNLPVDAFEQREADKKKRLQEQHQAALNAQVEERRRAKEAEKAALRDEEMKMEMKLQREREELQKKAEKEKRKEKGIRENSDTNANANGGQRSHRDMQDDFDGRAAEPMVNAPPQKMSWAEKKRLLGKDRDVIDDMVLFCLFDLYVFW
jgi:hypothetical protein